MAMDVLTEIKAAEEKAHETRRVAAAAAKEAIKLAEQENSSFKEKELATAKLESLAAIEAAQQEAKAELDALQQQRMMECTALKQKAEKNLSRAADICVERIVK